MPLNNEAILLTQSEIEIKQRINALTASSQNTGMIGVEWAERVLSPEWRDFWTVGARVMDYEKTRIDSDRRRPKFRKIAILVTDENFAIAQSATAEGAARQQRIKESVNGVCADMGRNNIEIFTIGLIDRDRKQGREWPPDAAFSHCAKTPGHRYLAIPENIESALFSVSTYVVPLCWGVGG